jgi:hypothetical protein
MSELATDETEVRKLSSKEDLSGYGPDEKKLIELAFSDQDLGADFLKTVCVYCLTGHGEISSRSNDLTESKVQGLKKLVADLTERPEEMLAQFPQDPQVKEMLKNIKQIKETDPESLPQQPEEKRRQCLIRKIYKEIENFRGEFDKKLPYGITKSGEEDKRGFFKKLCELIFKGVPFNKPQQKEKRLPVTEVWQIQIGPNGETMLKAVNSLCNQVGFEPVDKSDAHPNPQLGDRAAADASAARQHSNLLTNGGDELAIPIVGTQASTAADQMTPSV